jgi:hypothetical protein
MKVCRKVISELALSLSVVFLIGCGPGYIVGGQIDYRFGGIDNQPVWGPTGYDFVEYYYLPEIDVYYYVPQHRFVCFEDGRWVFRSSLPSRYRGYDLYHSYKIVVNERQPYLHDQEYRDKYSSYRNRHDQQMIRDSRDPKYFINKNHPQHQNWVKQQKQIRGKGNSNRDGNSRQDDSKERRNRD